MASVAVPAAPVVTSPASEPDAPTPRWFFRFFAVYAVTTLISLGLLYVDFFSDLTAPDPVWGSVAYRLFTGFVLVPAGVLIALLVLRHTHRNVTGLFLLMYAVAVMQSTLRTASPLQLLSNVINGAWLGLWLLPLYFPDGTAYPKRFQRWIRAHSVVTAVLFGLAFTFEPTAEVILPNGPLVRVPSPLTVPALHSVAPILSFLQGLTWISSVLLIIPSLLLRYRASRGLVRQQLKLFVWAFVMLVGLFIMLLPFFETSSLEAARRFGPFTPIFVLYEAVIFPAAPFAVVGYAVLRHRLYDIDVIIRRTAAYSVVTALLGAVYLGVVTLLQELFSRLVGSESPLAIVISTLTIAALFTPLRNRVQQTVDRVFYRRKYDAKTIIDQFGESLRDEMDVEHIQDALFDVVMETMQPEYVGLWLKSEKP